MSYYLCDVRRSLKGQFCLIHNMVICSVKELFYSSGITFHFENICTRLYSVQYVQTVHHCIPLHSKHMEEKQDQGTVRIHKWIA